MAQVYFELIKYKRMTLETVPAIQKEAVSALLAAAELDGNGDPIEAVNADAEQTA